VDSPNDNAQIDFIGAKDLGEQLAVTAAVQQCLVRKGFRFITSLPASHEDYDASQAELLTQDQEADHACAISQMSSVLKNSNQSPRAMFEALGNLEILRFRK